MKAKLVPRAGAFDLSEWSLDAIEGAGEQLKAVVVQALGELLELAAKEEVHVHFPALWNAGDEPSDGMGGPPVENSLLMHIELPIAGNDEGAGPVWSVDLAELIRWEIASVESGTGGPIDDEERPHITRLRDGLAGLVEELTAALARPQP